MEGIMNFKRAMQLTFSFFDDYGIDFMMKEEADNVVRILGKFPLKHTERIVFLNVIILGTGGMTVEFSIHDIKGWSEQLDLINTLNQTLTWLKAYVTCRGDLVLSHSVIDVQSEPQVISTLEILYGEFTDDDCWPLIAQLTDEPVSTESASI